MTDPNSSPDPEVPRPAAAVLATGGAEQTAPSQSVPLGLCVCGAPATGRDPHGRPKCCPACVFNPLGCRCRFGELGVSETMQLDFDEDPHPEYDAMWDEELTDD